LTEADDKNVAGGITFREQFRAASMTHHDSDFVEILQCFRCEIAKRAEMPMLAIKTIFRRVMRV
jgi:hypothetical protein